MGGKGKDRISQNKSLTYARVGRCSLKDLKELNQSR